MAGLGLYRLSRPLLHRLLELPAEVVVEVQATCALQIVQMLVVVWTLL